MQKSSNPTPPPDRLWLFDRKALHDGDVVLELGDSLYSRVITGVDGGPYSHALIWVGNTDFVESVGRGVRILSYERVIISDPECWLLMRQPNRQIGARAAQAARRMVSKYYNLLGAMTSVTPTTGVSKADALFCSELVAQAYLDAGLELVPNLPAHKVTPRLLLESSALSRVPPPLLECHERTRMRLLDLLDRDAAHENSLMDVEMRASRAAFAEVEHLLSALPPVPHKDVKNPPGNLHELIDTLAHLPMAKSRKVMDALLDRLQAHGYFHLLDKPFEDVRSAFMHNAMRLRYENMPQDERDDLRSTVRERCEGYGTTAQRYLRNAQICERLFQASSHALWQELAAMHRRNYQHVLILRALGKDLASDEWTAEPGDPPPGPDA